MLEVTGVKYISGYKLHLSFSDGVEGIVNLEDALWGPVFEPLRDVDEFQKVYLCKVLHTVAWPNDADFAPEYLREKVKEQARLKLRVAEDQEKYGAQS